ncbi:hypothetical protein Bbelb_146590 [Branchiostoma belcheri]|nr:hypothetical protein Bbelb_146590 [Branchiostoma belcheri]
MTGVQRSQNLAREKLEVNMREFTMAKELGVPKIKTCETLQSAELFTKDALSHVLLLYTHKVNDLGQSSVTMVTVAVADILVVRKRGGEYQSCPGAIDPGWARFPPTPTMRRSLSGNGPIRRPVATGEQNHSSPTLHRRGKPAPRLALNDRLLGGSVDLEVSLDSAR